MRKLASIQRIKALESIENADSILKATVLGWQLVVKKGEFKVGDLCVYCEIDSILPDKPEFEFLRPRKMRIRTVRLRRQISQGICFPLSILPSGISIEEGGDVTSILEITKYEPPIPAQLSGLVKGVFPSFIPKTDETRVQVLQDLLDKYVGDTCFVTEKLDGSSVTYFFNNGEFGVCSRNLELLETEGNSLWSVARELDLENKLLKFGKNLALQGEIIGEGIQKNKYRLRGQKVHFFNAFDIDNYQYFNFDLFMRFMDDFELESVPVLESDFALSSDIPTLVEKAIGKSVLRQETHREGIVIRPLQEKTDTIGRVSFKSINPKFLLKFEDA
ncbi:RNA ligase (ATP) [Saprospiraceae bacterium]|jgi:RNA ligase (TIGR02306 family)|nr:RNA ligase (ATP) [Bacteroidota bacterium]MDB4727156.1 RNA ligase (ATP) [Saprospiraceae bacterium]MDF1863392.1 RNA ligase (ATP) [Saprospiraceae bacterium]